MGTYNDISNKYLQMIALILQCIAISRLVLHYNGQTTQPGTLPRTICTPYIARLVNEPTTSLPPTVSTQVITVNIENLYK